MINRDNRTRLPPPSKNPQAFKIQIPALIPVQSRLWVGASGSLKRKTKPLIRWGKGRKRQEWRDRGGGIGKRNLRRCHRCLELQGDLEAPEAPARPGDLADKNSTHGLVEHVGQQGETRHDVLRPPPPAHKDTPCGGWVFETHYNKRVSNFQASAGGFGSALFQVRLNCAVRAGYMSPRWGEGTGPHG